MDPIWFTDSIIKAYILSVTAFFILRIFNSKLIDKPDGFLNFANGLILPVLLINLLYRVNAFIKCISKSIELTTMTPGERQFFHSTTYCYFLLTWTIIFGAIFHVTFISKKFRTNILATVFSVLLLFVLTNFDITYSFLETFYRDYLPTSWSVYYITPSKVWTLVFAIIYFTICFIVPKLKMKHDNG